MERRGCIRRQAWLRTSYRLLGSTHTTSSTTQDISPEGISLTTDTQYAPGVVLEIKIEIPERERALRVISRVIWSEPLVLPERPMQPRMFETGGRLLDISPEEQALLVAVFQQG